MTASRNPFRRAFWLGSIDSRPLGLFRVTFGLAALGSVLDLAPILVAGFSDDGFLPRATLLADVPWNRFSALDSVGPPWLVVAYWLLTVAAAVCFVVGYRTRLSTIVFFVLYHGFFERNRLLFDASDGVIQMLLLNGAFLPLGASYSVDAWLRRDDVGTKRNVSAFGVRLVQLQFCYVYLASFLSKSGTSWWDGSAVHRTLGLEHVYTRALGRFFDGFPAITVSTTYFTLVVEALFLPLVFLPFFQPRAKAAALIGGFLLHLGIWATLRIGAFSWVMVLAYPLLFEASWAAEVVSRARRLIGGEANESPKSEGAAPGVRAALRVLAAGIVAVSLACSTPKLEQRVPAFAREVVTGAGLGRLWAMFAPDPPLYDGYLRGVGKLENGTDVDVLRGHEDGGPLPDTPYGFFFSRWSALDERMAYSGQASLLAFGRYVCSIWNALPRGRPPLKTFRLVSVWRQVEPLGQPRNPWKEDVVWMHQCF